MHNALGVVAQLVRASACHAEGRGFEPRQSRQYLHRQSTVFFFVFIQNTRNVTRVDIDCIKFSTKYLTFCVKRIEFA